MPRIPYPDVAKLPEIMQKMLAGTPLNVVRMAAHASPAMFEAQGRLSYVIADTAVLSARIRETVILRVAYLAGSDYELHHHVPLAHAAGLTAEELAAIASGRYYALDALLAPLCRFVDELVLQISPSDEALQAMRAQVSDQALVHIVLTAAHYMGVARLIAVTGPEIDAAPLKAMPTGS